MARNPAPIPARSGPATSSRAIACAALQQHAEAWPDLAPIDLNLETKGLESRDAALAHAILHAAVARWITLGFLCEIAMARPWKSFEPAVQAALLAGSAQVLLLDKVPEHAAVDESVRWIKETKAAKAAGVVNAGLRALLRMRDAHEGRSKDSSKQGVLRAMLEGVMPADPMQRLAIASGVPSVLVASWVEHYGVAQAKALCEHTLCDPPTIFHTEFADGPSPLLQLGLEPHAHAGAHVLRATVGSHPLARVLASSPRLWVQDAAAQRVVRAMREFHDSSGAKPAQSLTIVDYCAGQGTKSRQLACTFPRAIIAAADTDRRRLAALREVATHFPNIAPMSVGDATRECTGKAGIVLLDVPCSNTGVLPRRPEAKYRVQTDQRDRLLTLQRQILRAGIGLLSPTGVLVYSTCSIDPAENHSQTLWACAELGLRVAREELTLPAGLPGGDASHYHDGAYHAMLVRA